MEYIHPGVVMGKERSADINKNTAAGNSGRYTASRINENAEAVSRETFEKLNDKKRRRHIIFVIAIMFLIVLLTIVFGAVCLTLFFRVERVYITGCDRYSPEEIIALSGIETEMSIYEPNSSRIEDAITLNCPYIKQVKLKRHLPSEIELELIEDTPYYYMEIGGEFFVLSEELRVLERLEHDYGLQENGLRKVVTPDIRYAVVGRTLRFGDEEQAKTVKGLLDSFRMSPVYEMLDLINLSDRYQIYVIYGGQFKIVFGKYTDMDLKLMIVNGIIAEMDEFNGLIDVSDIKSSFAIMDNSIVLE